MRIALHTGRRHSLTDERMLRTFYALKTGIGNSRVAINPPLTHAYDIIHAHDLDALPNALLHKLLTSSHTKIVYDAHEDWSVYQSSKPYSKLARYAEQMMLPFVDAATGASPAITARLAKTIKHTATILNCPELPPPPTLPKYENFTIAYAGHIGPHRGYTQLLEAARILNSQGLTDLRYLLMGHGTLDIPQDLQSQFTLTGQLPHQAMMTHLQRCHLGLILFEDTPNNRIALPHKLFEYMACGLPILASRWCDAIADIILAHDSGYTLEHCCGFMTNIDNPERLAGDIRSFHDDPQEAANFGHNALAAAKHEYNAPVQAAKLTALYGRIM